MKVRFSNTGNIFPRTSRPLLHLGDRLLFARQGQGHYHVGDSQIGIAFHPALGGVLR